MGSSAAQPPEEPEWLSGLRQAAEDDPEELNELGIALAEHGLLGDAEKAFGDAYAAGVIEAGENLGRVLAQQGRHDEACVVLGSAAANGEVSELVELGDSLWALGRLAEAEQAYVRGRDAGSEEAAVVRAELLFHQG